MKAVIRYQGNRSTDVESLLEETVRSYEGRPEGEFNWNNNTSGWDLSISISESRAEGLAKELKRIENQFSMSVLFVPVHSLS